MLHVTVRRTALSLFLISCGSPSDPEPSAPAGDAPVPEGVLLRGEDSTAALDATYKLRPSAAPGSEIVDGRHITRLIGVLNPDATVSDVNAALEQNDVRVVSMTPGNPLVMLKTPATDADEAERLAVELVDSGAFLFAFDSYEVHKEPIGGDANKLLPEAGSGMMAHLAAMRFPAAWNASRRAIQNDDKITVLVPDGYVSSDPHAEISAQSFVGPGGYYPNPDGDGDYDGNHGTHVTGIIGANFDATGPTGTSPSPATLLDLRSLTDSGLGWPDLFQAITDELPATGPVIISTSLGFPEDNFAVVSKLERALLAIGWRILISPHYDRVLHVTAAGNEANIAGDGGNAKFGSPFTVAKYFGDIHDVVDGVVLTPLEQSRLDQAWSSAQSNFPSAVPAATNTIVVGSADTSGSETSFSNRDPDLHAVGEDVQAPCAKPDSDCSASLVATYSGTSMATPVVAGLAAYLLNLDDSLTPQELIEVIQHSYENSPNPGLVDAYIATLALDAGNLFRPVRMSILDVTGSSQGSTPNGVFDEEDLEAFVTFFESFSTGGGSDDFSRYDLNGDGTTGSGITVFDLNVDDPPAFTTESSLIEGEAVNFDETAVSDLDVLCYYAFSDLYSGDETQRAALLADCLPSSGGGEDAALADINFQRSQYATGNGGCDQLNHPHYCPECEELGWPQCDAVEDFSRETEAWTESTVFACGQCSRDSSSSADSGGIVEFDTAQGELLRMDITANTAAQTTIPAEWVSMTFANGNATVQLTFDVVNAPVVVSFDVLLTHQGDGGSSRVELNEVRGPMLVDRYLEDGSLQVTDSPTLEPGRYRLYINTNSGGTVGQNGTPPYQAGGTSSYSGVVSISPAP